MDSFEEQSIIKSFNSLDRTLVDGSVEERGISFCKFKQEKMSEDLLTVWLQVWYRTCAMRSSSAASLLFRSLETEYSQSENPTREWHFSVLVVSGMFIYQESQEIYT